MLKDVGMAVLKTTETRCRDGSVQARHVIQKTTQVTPSLALFPGFLCGQRSYACTRRESLGTRL